jgi:elongation factor G
MKVYESKEIRNIALLGHAGSGKTSLAEALLFQTGSINRRGTVEELNTVSDYTEIEHEKKGSIFTTPLFTEYKNLKINILDTPGYDDYIGELSAAARVADTGVICLNAQNGLEVGSENAWTYTSKYNTPVMIVVNKLDQDQANFEETVTSAKEQFGRGVTVIEYPLSTGAGFNTIIDILSMKAYQYSGGSTTPVVKDIDEEQMIIAEGYKSELIDMIAETDEDLMTKYFDSGELTTEEMMTGLRRALINKQIVPVLCASSKNNIGADRLADFICDICPSPLEMAGMETTEDEVHPYLTSKDTSLFVFKLVSEAHLGDMTFFKVASGKVSAGADLINDQKSTAERFNQIFSVCGKKRVEVTQLNAGDIGATVKLKGTGINHTLHEKGKNYAYKAIEYPNPKVRVAIAPKTKGEEEKVGMGLHSLHQEDPTLMVEHSQELRQMIVYCQGELHLGVAKWRLEHRYKVETEFLEPRVPYRETIQKQVRGMYRHKKQSGGAGQFAEVHMIMEPWYEGAPYATDITIRAKEMIDLDWGGKLELVNCIVGGVIDQRFIPAILKGVMDKMHIGPLTGSYVRDIRLYIYDGKMHPVDSNEAAFKTAGMMVFKENFIKADPKILEPVYEVEIKVPEDFVGDVMSDLPTRRGLIMGIDSDGKYQKIKSRMPLAELDKYSTALRSMTQARATYTSEFIEYQSVPPNVQMKLMDEFKKAHSDED